MSLPLLFIILSIITIFADIKQDTETATPAEPFCDSTMFELEESLDTRGGIYTNNFENISCSLLYNAPVVGKIGAINKRFPETTLAFLTPWNSIGFNRSVIFRHKFDILSPVWFSIISVNDSITLDGENLVNQEWLDTIRSPADQLPSCSYSTISSPKLRDKIPKVVPRVLVSVPEMSDDMIDQLVALVKKYSFNGLLIDFDGEFRYVKTLRSLKYDEWLKKLGTALHKIDTILTLSIAPYDAKMVANNPGSEIYFEYDTVKEFSDSVDYFFVMSYDYQYSWVQSQLSKAGPGGKNKNLPQSWATHGHWKGPVVGGAPIAPLPFVTRSISRLLYPQDSQIEPEDFVFRPPPQKGKRGKHRTKTIAFDQHLDKYFPEDPESIESPDESHYWIDPVEIFDSDPALMSPEEMENAKPRIQISKPQFLHLHLDQKDDSKSTSIDPRRIILGLNFYGVQWLHLPTNGLSKGRERNVHATYLTGPQPITQTTFFRYLTSFCPSTCTTWKDHPNEEMRDARLTGMKGESDPRFKECIDQSVMIFDPFAGEHVWAVKVGEPYFYEYQDEETGEQRHKKLPQQMTLWYPSTASIAIRLELAKTFGVSAGIWEIGQGNNDFFELF